MSLLNLAMTFFIVANPIGNSPAIINLIKDFEFERQKKIMLRETIFALLVALFFQYLGGIFLGQLEIKLSTIYIAGGVLLLIVALDMIFSFKSTNHPQIKPQEPMFVPIATPLISGPALLTIIMLYSQKAINQLEISLAICIAWIAVSAILLVSPYMIRILKERGLIALEQLMGMILSFIAIEMVVKGIVLYLEDIAMVVGGNA